MFQEITQDWARRSARLIATLGLGTLVVLAVVMIADIAGRELFGKPIRGFSDVSDLMLVVAAAACFPAAIANRQHVAVRFLGVLHWRLREGLDLLGHVVVFIVFCAIAWQLSRYAADVLETGETTWLLYLPVWPVWMTATVIFAICVPMQLLQVIATAARLFSPVPLPDIDAIDPADATPTDGV